MKYLLASLVAVGLIGGSPIASSSGGLMQLVYDNPNTLTATEEDRKVNDDSRSERRLFQSDTKDSEVRPDRRRNVVTNTDDKKTRDPTGDSSNSESHENDTSTKKYWPPVAR